MMPTPPPTALLAVLLGAYRLGLRLYPRPFRAQFEDEMAAVFAERLEAETGRGGLALLGLYAAELGGLVSQGLREQVIAWQARPARVVETSSGPRLMAASRAPAGLARLLIVVAILVVLALVLVPTAINYAWARVENSPKVNQAALADLNGDGYLDAFLAVGRGNMPFPAYALYNDGAGRVGGTAQALGKWPGHGVALGDLNDDGHIDALLDITGGSLLLYLGDGRSFDHYGELPGASPGPWGVMRFSPVIGDLNGDGRLDVFAAGCCGREPGETPDDDPLAPPLLPYSQAWLQTPHHLLAPGPALGNQGSNAAALADLNGDGSLDAFLANGRTLGADGRSQTETPDTVWFNDGHGNFGDSGQRLGQGEGTAVALGDVNGDGWADAVVGQRGADEVWLNDGRGFFRDSGQRLGRDLTEYLFLTDLDGDGDLDLVAAGETQARAWFNDGGGQFAPGSQRLRYSADDAVAVGDLDGDGLADVLVAGVATAQVWHNNGSGQFMAGSRVTYRTER